MSYTEVYFDVVNDRLVRSLTSDEGLTLKWYQGMSPYLKCFPVMPTGNTVASVGQNVPLYKRILTSGHSLEVVVGPAAGPEAIKAAQYTWTPVYSEDSDGLKQYFYAALDLNTAEMEAAIGSAAQYETKIDFRLLMNGTLQYLVQADVIIKAVVKDPASASSLPTQLAQYLKVSDAMEMFPLWDNRVRTENAGRNIIFVSPNTTRLRELGVDDNGGALDNRY